MQLNIVILAAGKGTRMASTLPKVLHQLAGRPLLGHVIHTARQLNPKKICVVYGYGGDQVPNAFQDPDLVFVKQEPQLGTGHALSKALPHLDKTGVSLVLYGDVPLTTIKTLGAFLRADANGITVLTIRLSDPCGYGRIVRDDNGEFVAIVEDKDATEEQRKISEVNTGIMAIPNKVLHTLLKKIGNRNAQKEYLLTDIITLAKKQGIRVSSIAAGHVWETLGVNSKVQLAELERLYQKEYAHDLLAQGVTLSDPERIDVRGALVCGKDVFIDVNCVFEGAVRLGDGVKIGANSIVKNATIAAGTEIFPFCHIDDANIGVNCHIGPYARIRPGTQLGSEAHVGNFVEIKKSKIGAKSKANHLSYIGDSEVGRNVNIGAGTITCNYDGANKHKTVIQDDVFVGSDTQLVAPVTVHRGATIGAGTTVTRDVPAKTLTISRVKQTSIVGWKRPTKKSQVKS